MFAPGSIRKITIKNFVTYSFVELIPGPKFNLICGANGTGKSTIVAAIILGLGGNPKAVGRGKNVSDFVKHGCEIATITIHLQAEAEGGYERISRKINLTNQTSWTLNNQSVNMREVVDCIKKYEIQVDNLCQFLPQDRVQDFAKMNQQELLKETQMALCRTDLITKQEELVAARSRQLHLSENIDGYNNRLQEVEAARLRLEGKVENFHIKKKYLEQIDNIDRKICWVQYDELHKNYNDEKKEYETTAGKVKTIEAKLKPFEADIRKTKETIHQFALESTQLLKSIKDIENTLRFNAEKFEDGKKDITNVKNDMQTKIAEIEKSRSDIEIHNKRVEDLKVTVEKLKASGEHAPEKLQEVTIELRKLTTCYGQLERKRDENLQLSQSYSHQLRAYNNDLANLENAMTKRLNKLEQMDKNAYEATLWLRANKHLFKKEVYEPIIMEINVANVKDAKYPENIIGFRDKIAFICVDPNDMKIFVKAVREQKGLTVNVICSPDTGRSSYNDFQPRIPIEQLKQFGFNSYVYSLFTAPEPVMRYLCKSYRVNNIPVGSRATNNDVPSEVRLYFFGDTRYSVSYSKYGSGKTVISNKILSDGSLSNCVDVLQINNLKIQIDETRTDIEKFDNELKQIDDQMRSVKVTIAEQNTKLKYINEKSNEIQRIESRIPAVLEIIQRIKADDKNPADIKADTDRKITQIIKNMYSIAGKVLTCQRVLHNVHAEKMLFSLKITQKKEYVTYVENEVRATRDQLREAETDLNKQRDLVVDLKRQLKTILSKGKSLSNNATPDDPDFEVFRAKFDELSSNIALLQKEKDKLQTNIELLKTADDHEMREYERLLEEIDGFRNNVSSGRGQLDQVEARVGELREQWLQPLSELLEAISVSFSEAFERMGCAGEVSLSHGEDEGNYALYGVSIKVAYRNGEPMQELNRVVQSGGERAVATATYMMALQDLTPVPFRCVDEINQGMDKENEKRIFALIVEKTDTESTSQYFFITPKLLPDLKLSKSMDVHVVHNGPFIEPDRKYSSSQLSNCRNLHIG